MLKKIILLLALVFFVPACSSTSSMNHMALTNNPALHWSKPPEMTVIANYRPGWFQYSEFEYRYMASDIMVAQVFQSQGGWVWVVHQEVKGQSESQYTGVSWAAHGAMLYAEKRMWGMYWM